MELINEIWKNIDGYEGYQISNFGRVKSLAKEWVTGGHKNIVRKKTETMMSVHLNNWGYKWLRLSKNGKKSTFFIHIGVAKTFVHNPSNKPQVNHINGDKTCNYYLNLEWVTISENTQHAYDIGLAKGAQGEKSGSAKLTDSDIRLIRLKAKKESSSGYQARLAQEFNVASSIISRIINNKIWKHIV